MTSGISLYADDSAADLRATIRALSDLPVTGERLFEILLGNWRDSVALEDSGGPAFWLVVADQFERRGLRCAHVFEKAREIAATGADHRDFEGRGASPADLRKRDKIVGALIERLSNPRPERLRARTRKPPTFVVEIGQVYAFPIMGADARNPWMPEGRAEWFQPDGWGAMLIGSCRRVFEWIPLCVVASLAVDAAREPTLEDAVASQVVPGARTLTVPRRSHLKHMRASLVGTLDLDPAAAEVLRPTSNNNEQYPQTPENAAVLDWSFQVLGRASPQPEWTRVADLIRRA